MKVILSPILGAERIIEFSSDTREFKERVATERYISSASFYQIQHDIRTRSFRPSGKLREVPGEYMYLEVWEEVPPVVRPQTTPEDPNAEIARLREELAKARGAIRKAADILCE